MIEVCKGTNLSVFLQKIKQKEEMENKKPIVLNNLEEWDFTDYIDSLIQKEEAVDLEFKVAKDVFLIAYGILILLLPIRMGESLCLV